MFEYIKDDENSVDPILRQLFGVVTQKDIKEATKRMGYEFPKTLYQFFIDVGEGSFRHTPDFSETQEYHANRILHPKEIADIKLLGYDSGQIVPSVEFSHDEIPIFEVDGGEMFFVMKPQSDKPNAVYRDMNQGILEESFEKFIWRLYYESPLYYMKDWDNED